MKLSMKDEMSDDFPTPEQVRKEFERFVKDKFGGRVQIFAQEMPGSRFRDDEEEQVRPSKKDVRRGQFIFNLKPKEIKEYLDRFVIRQDEAKKALAIAVCDHYNHVQDDLAQEGREYYKQNVLILGPTGVGKTYLVKQIAKLIGIPFVKADATRFTETGYVGANVEDLVRDLVAQADHDTDLAQYGIVYIDEIDKLASSSSINYGRDISGRGVQIGLLKLMEETEIDLRAGNDVSSQMQAMMEFQRKGKVEKQMINTRHILFIVSGAFNDLKQPIKKRLNKNSIGFKTADERFDDDDLLSLATTQDFVDYGFEPEFIGRIPTRVACRHLSVQDIYEILKFSEGSIIKQYERNFAAFSIEMSFTDDALRYIAKQANQEQTGARGIMTVCENILRDFKFELPSTDIKQLVIDAETCANPKKALDKLFKTPVQVPLVSQCAKS